MFPLFVIVATAGPLPTSQPATQPAATQPSSPLLNKYYNLLKTEFMHDEDGNVVMTTNDAKEVIAQVQFYLLAERQILERQLKEAESQRNASKRQRRSGGSIDSPSDARRSYGEYRVLRNAWNQQPHGPQWTDADVREMKKRLRVLAPILSPSYRGVPPKTFWTYLSPEEQERLRQIGISLNEFRATIQILGWTEESFVSMVRQLEADKVPTERIVTTLLMEIGGRMKHVTSRPSAGGR